MNPDKFMHKSNEVLDSAYEITSETGHAQITLLHLAAALAANRSDVLRLAIAHTSAGSDMIAADSFQRIVASMLKRLEGLKRRPERMNAS